MYIVYFYKKEKYRWIAQKHSNYRYGKTLVIVSLVFV